MSIELDRLDVLVTDFDLETVSGGVIGSQKRHRAWPQAEQRWTGLNRRRTEMDGRFCSSAESQVAAGA
ncbi:hypothetical protein KFK09_005350 [Dendrobium nobile]|uniref:Uncharacterized protein n=1 Tax=Dendrobium nobile TaxID=94219 RepID=A0A8T3BY68_DENNO|nr:hypothetical protein KFK09_005350 [Dendrobium nobile]